MKTIDTELMFGYHIIVEHMFRTCVRRCEMKHKYRIVNKKRFFTFWFTIWLIAFIIITFFINHSKVYSSTYKQNYIEIVVKKGDTLWQIAKEHLPEDYDIRKMIHQIREVNNMEVADIYPGDLVKIPIIDMKNR